MAIFSIYFGLLYNECFSMPLTMFGGTAWHCPAEELPEDDELYKLWKHTRLCPFAWSPSFAGENSTVPSKIYPFGVDPRWHGTNTELTFLNSMKMKMSIVFGVMQMSLGVVC